MRSLQVLLVSPSSNVWAEEYPTRAVTLISSWPAGRANDAVGKATRQANRKREPRRSGLDARCRRCGAGCSGRIPAGCGGKRLRDFITASLTSIDPCQGEAR
jgi:hypothetical protein